MREKGGSGGKVWVEWPERESESEEKRGGWREQRPREGRVELAGTGRVVETGRRSSDIPRRTSFADWVCDMV